MPSSLTLRSLFFAAFALVTVAVLPAQTSWTGTGSTAWGDPANWTSGVPSSAVDATIAAGAANQPAVTVAGAAVRSLTLQAGATVDVGAGLTLDVHGTAVVSGAVVGAGRVAMVGSTGGSISGGGTLANLEIAKAGSAQIRLSGAVSVAGELTVSAGVLETYNNNVLSVGGDALFQGGSLRQNFGGTIDVAGNVTFAGTTASAGGPSFRCGGDWTADGAYVPGSGQTVFDGAAAQTVGGTGPHFWDLVVASGAAVTCSTNPVVGGSLRVDGTLATDAGTLPVGSDLTGSGTVDGAASVLSVGRTINLAGSVSLPGAGRVSMVGSANGELRGGGTLANLEIAKAGSAQVQLSQAVSVAGDFTVSGGIFQTYNNNVLSVGGDALFHGGSLRQNFGGTIDVVGNVTFAGTTALGAQPNLSCGGDWTADGAYVPGSGQTVLDGAAAQTVGGTGPRFWDLLVASGAAVTCSTNPVVGGSLRVDGTLTTAAGILPVGFDLTCSGTVDGAASVLSVGRTINLAGSVSLPGAGRVSMVGSANGELRGGGTLANLEIAKAGSAQVQLSQAVSVAGDLTVSGGIFQTYNNNVLSVGGDALFQGGSLRQNFGGTIDVAGNVTFAGTTALGAQPNLSCGGDWTADGAYVPGSGQTVLDGAAAQTVGGTGSRFWDLLIASGAAVTCSTNPEVGGSLRVDGTLTTAAGTLPVGFDLTCSGTVDGAASVLSVGRNLLSTGTVSLPTAGRVTLAGSTGGNISGSGSLPNLEIAKAGGAQMQLSASMSVVGDLTVTSGIFQTYNNSVLSVGGDALFQGGSLRQNFGGTIDVAGNVTFAGTTALGAQPNLSCGGDWTADGAYAPNSGRLLLDGGAAQQIAGAGPRCWDLVVATGSTVTCATNPVVGGSLRVDGTMTLASGALDIGVDLVCGGVLDGGQTAFSVGRDLNVTGSAMMSSGTHTVGRTLNVTTGLSSTGLFVCDSAQGGSISGGGSLPNLEIAKAGGAQMQLSASMSVVGDLTVTSGLFQTYNNSVLSVVGDALFQGGSLRQNFGGAIDVAGDVTFAGTTANGAQPDLYCGGDWTGDGAYVPNSGRLLLDGGAAQQIAGAGPRCWDLVVTTGSTVTCATNPVVGGSLQVDGTMTLASGALGIGVDLVCGGVLDGGTTTFSVGRDLNVTGSATMSSGTHTVGRTLNVTSGLSSTGLFVCDSAQGGSISGGGSLPNLEISKAGGALMQLSASMSLVGDLTVTSGLFQTYNNSVLSVGGDALFQGGSLRQNFGGAIDVAGDVTFAGTTANGGQPDLYCGGDWTADSAYVPSSGRTELDGTAVQTVGGAGPHFWDLVVASGATVTCSTNPVVGASLRVDGTLTTAAGTLPVGSDLTCSGTVDGAASVLSVGRNLTLTGAVALPGAGRVTLAGSSGGNISGGGSLPNLEISKAGGALMQLSASMSVVGDLTVTSGLFQTYNNSVLSVGGDALFQGGSLRQNFGGTLDVAGDVTFAGTTANGGQPSFRCGGDWILDDNYQVQSLVEFTGDGAVSHVTPGAPVQFLDLRLVGGRRTLGAPTVVLQTNQFLIDIGAALDVETNRLELHVTNDNVPIAGVLQIGLGGAIVFDPTAIVVIGPTGGLVARGDATDQATITGSGAGGYTLSIAGALAARNALFAKMGPGGVRIEESATLAAAPDDFRAVTLREPFPIAGAVLLDIRRTAPTELRYPRFENPAGTADVLNVTTAPTSQPITFVNFAGDLSGEAYESDPGDLLIWAAPQNTELLSFTGSPGIARITLDWSTADEPDVDAFVLQRGLDPSGPFTTIATVPATGPRTYQWTDENLDPLTTYAYQLSERIDLIGATNVLSTIQATPLSASVQLAFGTAPAPSATAGDAWPPFTVRIENQSGELNTNAGDTVTIQPVVAGSLVGTLSQPAVNGIATFAGLSATVAGPLNFDVTAAGLTPITGATVTIDPAAATELVFATAPASPVVAGATWPAFVVRAEDPYGNLDTAFVDDVDVVAAVGTGSLQGTTTRAAVAGVATFDDVSYGLAEAIEIACSTSTIQTPLTAPVTVEAGNAQFLVFASPPAPTQVAGEVFGAFTVEVQDALGNLVVVNGSDVTLGISTGTAALLGTLTRPLIDGVATFADVSYTRAESIRIAANLTGYTTANTDGIVVAPADPSTMVFVAEPPSLQVVGSALPPIRVQIEDAYRNVATQATEPVVLQFPAIDGNAFGTLSRTPVDGVATFDDVGVDTAQTARAIWNSTGLAALERTIVFTPFASDLRVASGSLLVTPAAPAAGQPAQIQVGVVNDGQVNAQATARFYLGDPTAGGTLIGQTGGSIGVGGNETYVVNWTPTEDGAAWIHAVIENLDPPDDTPGNNRAASLVYVGAPAVELSIAAGRRISWPGDAASVSVTIRNTGASTVTLASVVADSPWLTFAAPPTGSVIPPGGSVIARGDLAVPVGTAGGPLGGQPIVHPIAVEVGAAGGARFSGGLQVEVFDQPASALTVRVVDANHGNVVGGALLAFQDLTGVFSTDSSGEAVVNLPPGSRGIAAYKPGYVAQSQTIEVPEGASTVVLSLRPGETLAVQSIEERALTTAEITARGVDVNDPVNNHIVDFVVAMRIGEPITIPNVEVPLVGNPGVKVEVRREIKPPGYNDPLREAQLPPITAYGTLEYVATPGGGVSRVETWILVPGEIVILKDFFEVTAVVVNRAEVVQPTDVQLRAVTASIGTLPFGLALPDLDGQPQTSSVALGDLDANQTAQATWVVRGDEPGPYSLQVATVGDAYGFGSFLTQVVATAVTDPFEVTQPLISCAFDTPTAVTQGSPFDFGVRVTNEGSSVARLVRVQLGAAELRNCSISGTQSQATLTPDGAFVVLGDLQPGATGVATFQLVSALTGSVLELRTESGCGGNLSPPVTVVPEPPTIVTQPRSTTACEDAAAAFQVVAAGAGPLSYQWRKDGVEIAGAVAPDLVVSPVALGDAGDYTVVVTNEGGSTTSETATLTVRPRPQAAFVGDVLAGVAPLGVAFTDQSTGEVTAWAWDFGDGSGSPLQSPSHVYQTPGVYTVTLQITGPCGTDSEVKTGYVTVIDAAPVASFVGAPTVGTASLTVAFTDQSVGNVTTHAWDFGDGNGSAQQNPSHVYTEPGLYTVSLAVSGPGGVDDEVRTGYVRVEPQPTITTFAAARTEVDDGQTTSLGFVFSGGDGVVSGGGLVDVPVTSGGQLAVDPADSGATTYRLTVTNALGVQATADVRVTSYALPEITSFTAVPPEVSDGQQTTLGFTFTGGTGSIGGTALTSGGSLAVDPADSTTTDYTLRVTSPTGTQAQAGVTVTSYALPTITAFVATPDEVNDGELSTLSFVFTGETAEIGGQPVTSGVDIQVDPADSTSTTYTLSVENRVGARVTRDVTVTSYAAPEITAFVATPAEVSDGDLSTLSFAFTGHAARIGGQPVTAGVDIQVDPADSTSTTYTLVVVNELGLQVTRDVTVTSYALPTITAFVVDDSLVTNGTTVQLYAVFDGGDGVVDNGVGPIVTATPTPTIPPDDTLTTYRLTVRNPAGGEVTATVSVESVPAPTIQSFTASAATIENGQPVDLTPVFSSGDGVVTPGPVPVTSTVSVQVVPPQDSTTNYVLTVTNRAGDQVLAAVMVTAVASPPRIVQQPISQSALAGGRVDFSVGVSGSGPFSYRWLKDGTPIPSSDSSTLTLTGVQLVDAGSYVVEVTNGAGTVTSDAAVLSVLGACPSCDGGEVLVRHDVCFDFTQTPPVMLGDQALAPYVTYDTSGPTPDSWKAIVDVGSKRLVVRRCVTIATGLVVGGGGGSRREFFAPGLVVRSACGLEVEKGASIDVRSRNAPAGEIRLEIDGDVRIDGCVLDRSQGAAGRSGAITIAARCGDVHVGKFGVVQTDAGSDLTILTGGDPTSGAGGSIVVRGLVEASHRGEPAPTIRLVAFDGGVTIDGEHLRWLGSRRRVTQMAGVVVRATRNCDEAGRIEIQARGDVMLLGNTVWHWGYPNPGAVAIKGHGERSGGGVIDIRSLGGRILASDRAVDNVNHSNGTALNRLYARDDIVLVASGRSNSVCYPHSTPPTRMAVIDVSTVGPGAAGTNELRSFSGGIQLLNADTWVRATTWGSAGTDGANHLTSKVGVTNAGQVLPADTNGADDQGVSTPATPPALHDAPWSLGHVWH